MLCTMSVFWKLFNLVMVQHLAPKLQQELSKRIEFCGSGSQKKKCTKLTTQPFSIFVYLGKSLSSCEPICKITRIITTTMGFPGSSAGKDSACWCKRYRRCGFDPWVGKIPWRRAWQTTLFNAPPAQPVGLCPSSRDKAKPLYTSNTGLSQEIFYCKF